MHRTTRTLTALSAMALLAALAGCATTTAAVSGPTASNADSATPTATAAADPVTARPTTPPTPTPVSAPTPTAAPAAPAAVPTLAQHVYQECSKGAEDAGVTLTFTANPSGYTAADGHYQLVYPFTFNDGHTDPWAIYNCGLTDDTAQSTFLGGGLSDSH
ncbi:hypothetical protein ACLBWP_02005 [Microbacterium sp. M1A1_1b]